MSKLHRCPICHADWEDCSHTDTDVITWRESVGKKALEKRIEDLERRVLKLEIRHVRVR